MFNIIIKSIYYLADSYYFFGSNEQKFKMNDSEDYKAFIIKAGKLIDLCEKFILEKNKQDEMMNDDSHDFWLHGKQEGEGEEEEEFGTPRSSGGKRSKKNGNLKGGTLENIDENFLNSKLKTFKSQIDAIVSKMTPEQANKYAMINLSSIKQEITQKTEVELDKVKNNKYDNKIASEYRNIILKITTDDTTILNMEQYGFLEFCTSKEKMSSVVKKVVSKTVFIRTIFSLEQFKQMAQNGTIWKCAKNQIKWLGDFIKKQVFTPTSQLTTDQKYIARVILDQLENKSLLTSLFINNVIAVGFLIDPIQKSIVDDKIIFNTGNRLAIIRWININTSGWNAYTALSGSLNKLTPIISGASLGFIFIQLCKAGIWTLKNVPGLSYISQFFSGLSAYLPTIFDVGEKVDDAFIENMIKEYVTTNSTNVGEIIDTSIANASQAISGDTVMTPELQPTYSPNVAKGVGDVVSSAVSTATSAVSTATSAVSTATSSALSLTGIMETGAAYNILYWTSMTGGIILAIILLWREIKGWNSDYKSATEIISNIISKQIYHIIIVKGFFEVDSFDIDPGEAFISELNVLINTVITIVDGVEKLDPKSKASVMIEKVSNFFNYAPSEAALKDINIDFFATLLSKSTEAEIDKKLLTNLNIPVNAFANALLNIKSSDVIENRKKLQDYYDDKDKMLAELKKEKSRAP
jgi:hypothetical protein